MLRIVYRCAFVLLGFLVSLPALTRDATAQSPDAAQVNYGEILEVRFDIANVRIGSRDRNHNSTATYTAPLGFIILGHEIHREGHHSGVSLLETTQPGRLTYESGAMASLREEVRRGFIGGILSGGDDDDPSEIDGSATVEYLNFLKRFHADYRFVANTHATIEFSWFAHSRTFDHGAELTAHATIQLQRAATEADAERAAEIIRFAIAMGCYPACKVSLKSACKMSHI
ncbi:MAG: hypothetical protein OXH66_04625, partial [Gemmatimonadetes bacterium]|nr:hypothetical protein [Gemmatimonadota bacterium]